jgi:hypothetical protein
MSDSNKLSLAINSVDKKFLVLKKELDKYPFSFSLSYSETDGYSLCIDADLINSEDPIALSKNPIFSTRT